MNSHLSWLTSAPRSRPNPRHILTPTDPTSYPAPTPHHSTQTPSPPDCSQFLPHTHTQTHTHTHSSSSTSPPTALFTKHNAALKYAVVCRPKCSNTFTRTHLPIKCSPQLHSSYLFYPFYTNCSCLCLCIDIQHACRNKPHILKHKVDM